MICVTCGQEKPLCPTCGVNPPNVAGGSCAACVTADGVRLQTLADAIGCTRAEITSTLLEPIGVLAGKAWHTITAADVGVCKANPGGLKAIAAAVAMVRK